MKRYWWIPAALSVIAGTILIAVTLGKKIPGVPRVRTGEEARAILEKAREQFPYGLESGEYVRASLIIAGKITENHPRLTEEKVKEILKEMESLRGKIPYSEALIRYREALDAAAGGPDYEGGSGDTYLVYGLDDEGSSFIYVPFESISASWRMKIPGKGRDLGTVEPW